MRRLANDVLRRLGIGASRRVKPAWAADVAAHVPFFHAYSADDQQQFLGDVAELVRTRRWVGGDGRSPDERQRVVIAACAARLVLRLGLHYYNHVHTIVVHSTPIGSGEEGRAAGRAHAAGVVELAWSSVRTGLAYGTDGFEPATHEFAHMLDLGSGRFDGAPAGGRYHGWASALRRAYEAHAVTWPLILGGPPGGDRAEFFAHATEVFFERPSRLRTWSPQLYDALAGFYRQDPASDGDARD